MTNSVDLSFFLEPPELHTRALLEIRALAPLSMTTTQPGTYYRSQPAPTEAMMYGLLENALGWHFPEKVRSNVLKKLRSEAKSELGRGHPLKNEPWITGDEDVESGSGFVSILQHHLEFEMSVLPATVHFDDLWARHARGSGTEFPGGSRHYDVRLERVVSLERGGDIKFGDYSSYKIRDPDSLPTVEEGDKVHVKALRPQYPQYYTSPTPREYVIPEGPYRYRVQTTDTLAAQIEDALDDPAAPLYLGNNDGWVEVEWEVISQ